MGSDHKRDACPKSGGKSSSGSEYNLCFLQVRKKILFCSSHLNRMFDLHAPVLSTQAELLKMHAERESLRSENARLVSVLSSVHISSKTNASPEPTLQTPPPQYHWSKASEFHGAPIHTTGYDYLL
jgi:hypothetical protein